MSLWPGKFNNTVFALQVFPLPRHLGCRQMILPSPGRCSSGVPTTLSQLFCDASCKLAVSEFCLLYTQEAKSGMNFKFCSHVCIALMCIIICTETSFSSVRRSSHGLQLHHTKATTTTTITAGLEQPMCLFFYSSFLSLVVFSFFICKMEKSTDFFCVP